MFCDLHMHSTASDGTDEPRDLPRLVHQAGLKAFALTDHDTTAGLVACQAAAAELGLGFIPGIELSANPASALPGLRGEEAPRGTLHLLGYGVQHDAAKLVGVQERLLQARADRNPQIVANLQDLGVNLDYDEVLAEAGANGEGNRAQIVGRPHIAQVLVKKGYVKSIHEAFAKYIGEGKAAYARKDRLSAADAIEAIHDAGGLAVLAHPVQLRLSHADDLELMVKHLVSLGLDGIETRHSDHTPADVKRFQGLASQFKLLETGGSDYHGSRKTIELGASRVPHSVYDRLVEAGMPQEEGATS